MDKDSIVQSSPNDDTISLCGANEVCGENKIHTRVIQLEKAIKKALHKLELEHGYGKLEYRYEYYEGLKRVLNGK